MTDPEESASIPAQRARLTPYELVFGEGDFESRIFPRIRAEAEAAGVRSLNPEQFEFLSVVGDVIREVTPEDAPPEALEQYRTLLFHAYNFWNGRKRLYVLDTSVARYLVEAAPRLRGWSAALPVSSAYLQLPANLFWSSIAPEIPPEPVDGFFITVADGRDASGRSVRRLEVLLILGIRRSRAGFSVIPLTTEITGEEAEAWEEKSRPEGDFANTLPGGEISGLYSMLTTAEVMKLVARAFWYIDSFPDALEEIAALEEGAGAPDAAPMSRLPYTRITLGSATNAAGKGAADNSS